jgi:hypothetical protein
MAKKLSSDIPELSIAEPIISLLDRHRGAGVEMAVELIGSIRESHAFDGVHLIPTARYREVSARLERLL